MAAGTQRTSSDACGLLDADHREVKKMFTACEALTPSGAAGAARKWRDLANEICMARTVRAQIEDEVVHFALGDMPSRKLTCSKKRKSSMAASRSGLPRSTKPPT